MQKGTVICICVLVLIFFAIIITCAQLSNAVKKSDFDDRDNCPNCMKMKHVIALSEDNLNHSFTMAERFPYVAAITRNASNHLWSFACFATVILYKWIVTSAHCRMAGFTHRVVLFRDFAQNRTYAFPILLWRVHERFNNTIQTPKYDIAVAKLNTQHYPYQMRPAVFNETEVMEVEASVWKSVSTMDKKLYLTNHFDKYEVKLANAGRCYESYGVEIDDSLMCIDSSDYEDCFIHEFGPLYSEDRVVGIIAVTPVDCDMKLSIFTNVSYFTSWILRTTHEG